MSWLRPTRCFALRWLTSSIQLALLKIVFKCLAIISKLSLPSKIVLQIRIRNSTEIPGFSHDIILIQYWVNCFNNLALIKDLLTLILWYCKANMAVSPSNILYTVHSTFRSQLMVQNYDTTTGILIRNPKEQIVVYYLWPHVWTYVPLPRLKTCDPGKLLKLDVPVYIPYS